MSEVKNIVLVHGGFVDGSGWQGVYDHLTADGYRVSVVQNPTLSLAGDVAATHQVLDGVDGPAVLVGHSYGGAVITNAAVGNPNVKALVYVAAFAGAEELADEITRFAAPRRIRLLLTLAAEIRTRAALGRGEYEAAFRQATLVGPAGVLPHFQAPALWLMTDLVESAVLSGRHAEAEAHVAALYSAQVPAISGRLALVTHGAAAMTAADDRFVARFERALALPDADTWPFDLARIQLFYGERLRRARATQTAREQLGAALGTFTRLGASPWADRARSELRASGIAAVQVGASPDARLPPQQYEIARLAAAGLTNKEIGQRLHLSPRTVGSHLYQVFPKLGITSRAALRDVLRKATAGGGVTGPPVLPSRSSRSRHTVQKNGTENLLSAMEQPSNSP
ncbi:alpha/beta fold hydrolase [Streptomyces sp. NPDC058001]|uniref:alpha/beta fold hydrolase n=1 Tax=Streptomyces sp. NPDC058001 TaxID=3346300 RepID=UPI0036EBD19C